LYQRFSDRGAEFYRLVGAFETFMTPDVGVRQHRQAPGHAPVRTRATIPYGKFILGTFAARDVALERRRSRFK